MIKSLTATTREIDDPQAAVAEILAMLDPDKNLLQNSLGIISCFSEFNDTGVLKAVCGALPFDCIGATSCLCSTANELDEVIFAITVLTSDDCGFATLQIPIEAECKTAIEGALAGMLGQSMEKPALLFTYFPLMNLVSGDMMMTAIDGATGGVPLFVHPASDHTIDASTAQTIHNGNMYRESIVIGAVYGATDITFGVASLDEGKFRKQKAIITESEGNLLIGVNGKNAMGYLEEIGFTTEQLATGLGAIPLVVDYMDGTKPVVRAVFSLTPEGHVVCGGKMPVDATLGIGRIDRDDVIKTAHGSMQGLAGKGSVIICYSCIGRHHVLGMNNTAEAETVMDTADGAAYLFAYTHGEICPLPDKGGKLHNVFHNFTIVFCRLR